MRIDEYTVLLRSAGTRTLFELAQVVDCREGGYRVVPEQLVAVRKALATISRIFHDLQVEEIAAAAPAVPRRPGTRSPGYSIR